MYIDSVLELYVYLPLSHYLCYPYIHTLSVVLLSIIYFPPNNLCSICLSSIYVSIHLSVIHLSIHTSTYYLKSVNIPVYHHHLFVYIGYAIAVIKHHSLKQQKSFFQLTILED